jgi:ubiquinone/menaquinone biosynthesis C-methylase UbiE
MADTRSRAFAPPAPFHETCGTAVHVPGSDRPVVLGLWCAPHRAPGVRDFTVTLGGEPVSFTLRRDDSPDVQAARPELYEAGRARFFLTLAPSVTQADLRDRLLCVTPRCQADGGAPLPGCHLYVVVQPSLPALDPELTETVGGGTHDVSFEFLAHFVQRAGLQPHHDVLDAGCGVGRMAYGLAFYLAPAARYEGFDIVADSIAAAQRTFGPHRPSFRFRTVDVWNSMYNPNGRVRAGELAFPYPDASFDFAFLTSVFTHMHARDLRHYVDEFARVLRPGGRLFVTCFLLDAESRALIAAGRSAQAIVHPVEEAWVANPKVPEAAIGFERERFCGWFAERGFDRLGLYPGTWCGRRPAPSFQDIVVFERRP